MENIRNSPFGIWTWSVPVHVCRVISLLYFSVAAVAGCVCDCRPHNLLHSNSILDSVPPPPPPSRVRPFTKFTLYSLCAFFFLFFFFILCSLNENWIFSVCRYCVGYAVHHQIFAGGSDMLHFVSMPCHCWWLRVNDAWPNAINGSSSDDGECECVYESDNTAGNLYIHPNSDLNVNTNRLSAWCVSTWRMDNVVPSIDLHEIRTDNVVICQFQQIHAVRWWFDSFFLFFSRVAKNEIASSAIMCDCVVDTLLAGTGGHCDASRQCNRC